MNSLTDKRHLCRLCGVSKDVVLLHIFAKENAHIQKEIEFLIKIKPSANDALPPYICHRCNYRITAFKDFRNMCIKTLHHLQDKNVNSNEDDEVVIIDERTGDIPIPCRAQHGRNTEKENMSNEQYSELQDPQPQSSSTSQQFVVEVSEDANTYTKDQPLHNKVCRKHSLPASAAPFHKKRQSADRYRDQRELIYQQTQALSLQYKRECIMKSRKLQHGFANGPSLPDIPPEVVDEQVGTVGYLLPEAFSSQSNQVTQRMVSLDSNQQHDQSTDELRTQQLEAAERNGFRESFSDCETIRSREAEAICCALCSRNFQNSFVLREHLKSTHGFFQSERKRDKHSFSCQSVSQPHRYQQLLYRGYAQLLSCNLCSRKFTNTLILKRHMSDNHSINTM